MAKLRAIGDARRRWPILDIVLNDEITHVAIGDRWFRHLCATGRAGQRKDLHRPVRTRSVRRGCSRP
jgi:uncharacterized ferritin-like protein (DUF455 family)